MTDAPHAITRLTLENFRNYRALTLDLPPRPVVLVGHNGAGKTNILEAISLFAPGRGLRGARLRVMDFIPSPLGGGLGRGHQVAPSRLDNGPHPASPLMGEGQAWVVAAQVVTNGVMSQIGTGRVPPLPSPSLAGGKEGGYEKRLIKIDGEKIRTQAALAKAICVQWLTPSMDQVFVEGGGARRDLLDRIVYGFDPEHASRVTAYSQAMRERNRLLADRGDYADPAWMTVLERQMAEHGVAMTLARLEAIARVVAAMNEEIAGFPTASLRLEGVVEMALGEGASALEAEELLVNRLTNARDIDSRSGRCSEGVHRSRLEIIHHAKHVEIEHCSTGEQKAILLSLILAAARARSSWCGVPPILLLDEVIAHLDVDKRRRLFDLIHQAGIQAWMTGTDAADFQGMHAFATTLKIAGGTVEKVPSY